MVGMVGIMKIVKIMKLPYSKRNLTNGARGHMPRKPPPRGLLTSKDAAARLGVTPQMLSIYVKQGKIHREGPESRTHKFYIEAEIDALAETERAFFEAGEKPKKHITSFFGLATPGDLPIIIDIDKRTFHEELSEETYLRWMKKNPETFFVLRDAQGKIIGFACLLPIKKTTMEQFVRDEVSMDDISPEDIDLFEPGKPLHLYIIALCVDPTFKVKVKHSYGGSLVRGTFTFILNLGRRGVEIETVTARTFTADGLRLLRAMGIPQLRSPVPGKHLFEVRIADSGFSIFERYSSLLAEWKQEHQQIEE
jgi:hypothetical protein